MKIIITTILTSLTLLCFGQEPHPGTYFTTKKDIGFESDIFQFQEDGTFSYIFFTCTGTGFGKGIYEVVSGDSLQLQFTDCLKCEENIQIESEEKLAEDSLEINLTIREWTDDSELAGVNVYFPSERKGTVSNENGQATFKTNITSENRTLRIQFIGYDPIDLEVPANTSRLTGNVYLTWHWIYDSSDIKTYKILKWTRSKLKLKRYPDWSITYDKVNDQKTDELIKSRMGETRYELYINKIKTPANDTYE
ncbi:carboxypeptidase-like regulatory domain-containing protein [Marivirga sp. S37H4]|uniref:Carboxypeptidase-like regulatory domain-containing protein n=1 Tax=Marivirga aurantiaca TaxID=2802615 RepID=A0A935C6Q9_9BACT|nr:carboxypeptidase-like regulatory domain-containing protein [Marivirga aurantiaca]MBK6264581.1 carboxypeptidase-like regulatory domain-containing protein [Marivirga aurantiaca]